MDDYLPPLDTGPPVFGYESVSDGLNLIGAISLAVVVVSICCILGVLLGLLFLKAFGV